MCPVTSVRCDWFSFNWRLSSSSERLVGGAGADSVVGGAAGVGGSTMESSGVGGAGVGAIAGDGAVARAADRGVTVRARVGAAFVEVGALAPPGTVLGIRTDFLHRLQSNDLIVAPAATTSGAEQCGQSKRSSLLAVPVCDPPPFCMAQSGSSHYTTESLESAWLVRQIFTSSFRATLSPPDL